MTKLARAAQNWLAQHPSVTSLLGSDDLGPWVFANRPEATIENSGTSMIVVTVDNGWGANGHNTARFPILVIDIWSDPTRNADGSVKYYDADTKAERVYEEVDKLLHLVDRSAPSGGAIFWGTATQVSDKTGVRIISSERDNEPSYSPAIDDQGAVIATIRYNVSI